MESIRQWAACLCFAAAAAGICRLLIPSSGLGRTLQLSLSVFFLCSVLLPLRSLHLPFVLDMGAEVQQQAEQLSEQTVQQSQSAALEMAKQQIESELTNFLLEEGITPVRIGIDMMQQDDSVTLDLYLLLRQQDRPKESWLREHLASEQLRLTIEYQEGENSNESQS